MTLSSTTFERFLERFSASYTVHPSSYTMTDTAKLKRSRRNTKGKLTRTLVTINGLLHDDAGDLETLMEYATKAEQFRRVGEKHAELVDSVNVDSQYEEEEKWMTECEKELFKSWSRQDVSWNIPLNPQAAWI